MRTAIRLAITAFSLIFVVGIVMMLFAKPHDVSVGEMPKQFGLGVLVAGIGLAGMTFTAVVEAVRLFKERSHHRKARDTAEPVDRSV